MHYVLLAVTVLAAALALCQRKPGPAILLLGSMYVGVEHVRMFALTACVVVVVGGAILTSAAQDISPRILAPELQRAFAAGVTALLAMLVFVRCADVVRDRNLYPWTFGAGLGWQFPENAAAFIEREKLPGEIFNTYGEGGYFVWRLGPKHRDYLDGRALPFGPDIFRHESELLQFPLDSEVWQQEAERYNINTILLPLNRFEAGLGAVKNFCRSTGWRPVYLDEVGAVFVRRRPETEGLISRFPVDCSTAPLPAGAIVSSAGGAFNQWTNAADVLSALGRHSEALAAAGKADPIVPNNAFIFWLRGNVYSTLDLGPEAEREYRRAISIAPYESVMWFSLATLYKHEGRIQETIQAEQRALKLTSSPQPKELLKLAELYLQTGQPKAALETLDQAVRHAPPDLLAASGYSSFKYLVAIRRAVAWRALGDSQRATSFEEESVRDLVPQNPPKDTK